MIDEPEPVLDRRDRHEDLRPGRGDVVRLADVERDRSALALDEQPRRASELLGDARCERLGGDAVGLEAGLDDGGDGVRRPAPVQPRGLQAVVAEILDAPDPGPGRHVGHRAPGEDGGVQPARPRGRDAGQPAQRPTSAGIDARRRGVARAGGQRAVEVGDEQQWPRRGHEPVERRGDRSRIARRLAQGVTSTPGRIVWTPRTMTSAPIPPRAPSRMIPSVSIQKWTGRTDGVPRGRGGTVRVEPERERRVQFIGERRHRALVLLDVDREDDEAVVTVPGGEAVHQRELVLARRAVRAHEVHPDRLALEAREVDRPAADPGHHQGRGRFADMERAGRTRRRRRRRGGGDRGGRGRKRVRRSRGRGRGGRCGGEHRRRRRPRAQEQDPPEDQRRRGDAGQEAGDDRQTRPHGRERTSTSGRRRPQGPTATMPVPCQVWPSALAPDSFPPS